MAGRKTPQRDHGREAAAPDKPVRHTPEARWHTAVARSMVTTSGPGHRHAIRQLATEILTTAGGADGRHSRRDRRR